MTTLTTTNYEYDENLVFLSDSRLSAKWNATTVHLTYICNIRTPARVLSVALHCLGKKTHTLAKKTKSSQRQKKVNC